MIGLVVSVIIAGNCSNQSSGQQQKQLPHDTITTLQSQKVKFKITGNLRQRRSFATNIDSCRHTDLTLPLKPLPDSLLPKRDTVDELSRTLDKYRLTTINGLMIDGSRDCAEIVDTIYTHLPYLRCTYNKMLRLSPGLVGSVGFWFVIIGSGKVIDCRIVETTMNRTDQQDPLVNDILEWRFNPLPDSTDTTIAAFSLWFGS